MSTVQFVREGTVVTLLATRYRPETQAFLDEVFDQLEQFGAEDLPNYCGDWEALAIRQRAWGASATEAAEWLIENTARPSIHRLQEVRRT